MTKHRSEVDIAIVGAGAAGLGAARAATDAGASFIVLEARPRIGGRAFTDSARFGFPWDLGCHWLHSADVNSFTALADRFGIAYRSEPSAWLTMSGGRALDDRETQDLDAYLDVSATAIQAAAASGRDVALPEVLDLASRWAPSLRRGFAAEWASEIEWLSTMDVAGYRDTNQNWPVSGGYGEIVARLAAGIPVQLGTRVQQIDWNGDGVRIDTSAGTIRAAAVIVTASTSALAAGTIAFAPDLPAAVQEAFAALPCGRAEKVGIAIDKRWLGVSDYLSMSVEPAGPRGMSFQFAEAGRDFANAYIAGDLCDELDAEGPGGMEAAAIDALLGVIGGEARRAIGAVHRTNWRAEETILGSYAAALPGKAGARAVLREPVGDRIFFAGEALHPEFYSTCHGADESGWSTARAALAALGALPA